jgi:TRAP-type uncharacterized transport system fused permease subunit
MCLDKIATIDTKSIFFFILFDFLLNNAGVADALMRACFEMSKKASRVDSLCMTTPMKKNQA